MAIQLDYHGTLSPCFNKDIEKKEILCRCDLMTVLECRQVCSIWNTIILEPDFSYHCQPKIPALKGFNLIPLLSNHAANSEEGITVCFEKFMSRTEPGSNFSFSCFFLHNPENYLFLHRNTPFVQFKRDVQSKKEGFCILMQPVKTGNKLMLYDFVSYDESWGGEILINNFPWKKTNNLRNKFKEIILKNDHPNTRTIRIMYKKYLELPMNQRKIIEFISLISIALLAALLTQAINR